MSELTMWERAPCRGSTLDIRVSLDIGGYRALGSIGPYAHGVGPCETALDAETAVRSALIRRISAHIDIGAMPVAIGWPMLGQLGVTLFVSPITEDRPCAR